MVLLQIPLLSQTVDQTCNIEINNEPYTLRVLWNENHSYFSLSISEVDGLPILQNIKMVNDYPLIGRFKALPINGDFYFTRKDGNTSTPAFDDLGTAFGLFYYDAEDAIIYPTVASALGISQTIWDGGNTIWDGGSTSWI